MNRLWGKQPWTLDLNTEHLVKWRLCLSAMHSMCLFLASPSQAISDFKKITIENKRCLLDGAVFVSTTGLSAHGVCVKMVEIHPSARGRSRSLVYFSWSRLWRLFCQLYVSIAWEEKSHLYHCAKLLWFSSSIFTPHSADNPYPELLISGGLGKL